MVGFYSIVYRIKASGVVLMKSFDSRYQAWRFYNRLAHSKRAELVSYPNFNE